MTAPDEPIESGLLQRRAAHGVTGPSQALPHRDAIQASFGRHDVSGVQAHVGGRAAEATGAMGAAYATGNDVAFGSAPDLLTAAHEAAHVIQQRHGVQLLGGVGRVGDRYEQHADAVASLVVQDVSYYGHEDAREAMREAAGTSTVLEAAEIIVKEDIGRATLADAIVRP